MYAKRISLKLALDVVAKNPPIFEDTAALKEALIG